jgi:hypothetical protein
MQRDKFGLAPGERIMRRADKWSVVNNMRLEQVRKLLTWRYGPEVPKNDAGIDELDAVLNVKARCYDRHYREAALLKEIDLLAPWMPWGEARRWAKTIARRPSKFKVDTLGKRLNLDAKTRHHLGLWQIGAVDEDAEARKANRKRRDRDRKRIGRAKRGGKTRKQFIDTSLSKNSKPWVAEGISRRTWYRRQSSVAQSVCNISSKAGSHTVPRQTGANAKRAKT